MWSSIYKSTYYEQNKDEKRINTDEMVARIGSWKDSNLQMKCAREAVKLIKLYISEKIHFNQETTLSGKSIISNIKKAKQIVNNLLTTPEGRCEALAELVIRR
jgi:predicted ABC-type ATPase